MQALNNAKSDLRADKSQLQNAYNKLTEQVSTNGKTPSSIKNMKQRVKRLKLNIMRLKMKLSECSEITIKRKRSYSNS